MEDGYQTIQKYSEFANKYKDLPGLKIGVVLGKTYDELVDCYRYMSQYSDYIAISFDYSYYILTGIGKNEMERYCDGRRRFIQQLKNDGLWNSYKPHHLLGCSLAKEFSYYRGDNSIGQWIHLTQ